MGDRPAHPSGGADPVPSRTAADPTSAGGARPIHRRDPTRGPAVSHPSPLVPTAAPLPQARKSMAKTAAKGFGGEEEGHRGEERPPLGSHASCVVAAPDRGITALTGCCGPDQVLRPWPPSMCGPEPNDAGPEPMERPLRTPGCDLEPLAAIRPLPRTGGSSPNPVVAPPRPRIGGRVPETLTIARRRLNEAPLWGAPGSTACLPAIAGGLIKSRLACARRCCSRPSRGARARPGRRAG